jgi:ABC-2 type transport system ATP-binding protein
VATAIRVEGLVKSFRVTRRGAGLVAALRALVAREVVDVHAVRGIDFSVEEGERVGFLGPNGAGKTTTLKMLAGLLHPSAGRADVLGHVPHRRRRAFLRSIALVMGQKRQLAWDLPALDTFELNRVVYEVPRAEFRSRLDEMVELLGLASVVHKPVRQLSLGERMKCELVASLLHGPRVLFLDEPTIGMDVSMQLALREFVRRHNEQHGATVVLTSHYMQDVAALCPRIVVIDEGRLRFDGSLEELRRRIRPLRRVSVRFDAPPDDAALADLADRVEREGDRVVLDVSRDAVPRAVERLLALPTSSDLTVEDAPLEEVMRELFERGREQGRA